MSTFEITIPTYNRIGKAPILNILKEQKDRVIVVVRPEEADYYLSQGWSIRVLPSDINHLGATTHWIFTNSDADYIWRVDDDTMNEDLIQGIEYITYYAHQEKAGIFGYGKHFMVNNRLSSDGEFSRRGAVNQIWGVNREMYLDSGIDNSDWPLMADLNTNIGMQVAGFRILMSNYLTSKEKNVKSGGCLDYRTPELVKERLLKLQETFPDFVHVFESDHGTVQKISTGLNFRVSWKKIHDLIPRRP